MLLHPTTQNSLIFQLTDLVFEITTILYFRSYWQYFFPKVTVCGRVRSVSDASVIRIIFYVLGLIGFLTLRSSSCNPLGSGRGQMEPTPYVNHSGGTTVWASSFIRQSRTQHIQHRTLSFSLSICFVHMLLLESITSHKTQFI